MDQVLDNTELCPKLMGFRKEGRWTLRRERHLVQWGNLCSYTGRQMVLYRIAMVLSNRDGRFHHGNYRMW